MSEQIAVRIPDQLISALDDLVAGGRFSTRAAAVRSAIEALVDAERRNAQGEAIAAGYLALPQTEDEIEWARKAAILSIAEEPW